MIYFNDILVNTFLIWWTKKGKCINEDLCSKRKKYFEQRLLHSGHSYLSHFQVSISQICLRYNFRYILQKSTIFKTTTFCDWTEHLRSVFLIMLHFKFINTRSSFQICFYSRQGYIFSKRWKMHYFAKVVILELFLHSHLIAYYKRCSPGLRPDDQTAYSNTCYL